MNIVTETFSGKSIVRPDTTFAKAGGEFYVPDGVRSLNVSPVIFSKITRAAKAVPLRFTPRYFQDFGVGVYLYPDGDDFCDRTSYLPLEMFTDSSDIEHHEVTLSAGGKELWSVEMENVMDTIASALAHCTIRTFVRRGDYIVKELADPVVIFSGHDSISSAGQAAGIVSLSLDGVKIVDINVIF